MVISNNTMILAFPPSFHSLSFSIFLMSKSTIENSHNSCIYQRAPMPLNAIIKYLITAGTSCMELKASLIDMLTYPWMN